MTSHSIALITDSTCDIPQELVDQYKITIIPQVVVWGEEVYFDREEIKPLEFYHRMEVDPILPTTSQPSRASASPSGSSERRRPHHAGASCPSHAPSSAHQGLPDDRRREWPSLVPDDERVAS